MNSECAIVIATHNRAGVLKQTLQRLYELPERPRLYVVDNASTDDTDRVWRPFGNRVEFIKLRRNIGAAARTIGARKADTPFIAFCDDDCFWTEGSLQCGIDRLSAHPEVAVLNARVLVGAARKDDPACQAMRAGRLPGAPGVPIVYFMAGACIMRRDAFLGAGGYHVRYFIGAEESLLALDLAARGWQLWYCEDIVVLHTPSSLNRDPDTRRRLVLRNRLWTLLLRRSAASAMRTIAQYASKSFKDQVVRAALAEAIAGLPWILRERRCISHDLELRVAAFDRPIVS
ncbi:MAG TPA: glycosyltransferase [Candidatus Baltobacteraceae bacterium]|nr:glycosyltransferase [Candidatus Baltobacteraceae bacterium]